MGREDMVIWDLGSDEEGKDSKGHTAMTGQIIG